MKKGQVAFLSLTLPYSHQEFSPVMDASLGDAGGQAIHPSSGPPGLAFSLKRACHFLKVRNDHKSLRTVTFALTALDAVAGLCVI